MSQKEQLAKLAVEWLKGYKADERSLPELLEAAFLLGARAMQEETASQAGGWTGEINTVENAAVVSEVCRQIRRAILNVKPEELL